MNKTDSRKKLLQHKKELLDTPIQVWGGAKDFNRQEDRK